jgi:MFS family permease
VAALLVAFGDELWSGVAVVAAPSVEREQGLDHQSYALFVFALPFVLSAVLDAGLSLLCDRLSRRRLKAFGLAGTSLSLLLVAGASSAFWLSCGLALAGAASGLACSAARAELLARHPGARDLALARWTLFGGIGDLASPLLVGAVLAFGGSFRVALWVVAGVLALQAVAAWCEAAWYEAERNAAQIRTRGEPEQAQAEPLWSSLRAAAGQRRLWLWLLGAGLCTLLDEIVLAFAALRLRLELGGTDAAAASCGVALSLGATLGAWLTEQLLARLPARRLLLLAAAACLFALVLVLLAPSAAWLLPALFLLGITAAPQFPLLEARAHAELPGRPGLVQALSQVSVLIEIAAPAALGALAHACGLRAALGALALQPLVALWLLWLTRAGAEMEARRRA